MNPDDERIAAFAMNAACMVAEKVTKVGMERAMASGANPGPWLDAYAEARRLYAVLQAELATEDLR